MAKPSVDFWDRLIGLIGEGYGVEDAAVMMFREGYGGKASILATGRKFIRDMHRSGSYKRYFGEN